VSLGGAVVLLVLVALVALAAASYFRNMLTALLVLVGIPVAVFLHALVGSLYTLFALAALATACALIHTITDTLRLVRAAKRTRRRPRPHVQQAPTRTQSERSRIAA
jgi:hypothetical protein